jgi:hypothetical protein
MKGEIVSGMPWSKGLTAQECTMLQISKLVEGTTWADSLSAKEIQTLSHYLHVCVAETGAAIVQEGRREAYLCLIVEGRVNIMKEGAGRAAKQIGSAWCRKDCRRDVLGRRRTPLRLRRCRRAYHAGGADCRRFCMPLLRSSPSGDQGPAQDIQTDQPATPANQRNASRLSRWLILHGRSIAPNDSFAPDFMSMV